MGVPYLGILIKEYSTNPMERKDPSTVILHQFQLCFLLIFILFLLLHLIVVVFILICYDFLLFMKFLFFWMNIGIRIDLPIFINIILSLTISQIYFLMNSICLFLQIFRTSFIVLIWVKMMCLIKFLVALVFLYFK